MTETTVQLTRCPHCGGVAEIERRTVLESTDGPIEHVRVRCIDRHWFDLPVHLLAPPPRPARRPTVVPQG